MKLFDLRGKVAIVTGSTKGIGKATVERMAEHGAKVVVSSRNQADCDTVAAEINKRYGAGRALPLAADIDRHDDLKALVAKTLEKFGRIDILVANASSRGSGTIEKIEVEEIDRVWRGAVTQSALLAKLVAEPMKKQGGGSIMFVSSSAATAVFPDFPAYGVGKHGLIQLARILAVQWGPDNLRVNCIVPGVTRTDATRGMWESPEGLKVSVSRTPLGRVGEVDELAAGMVFFASPGGAFITGHTLLVDGGVVMKGAEGIHDFITMASGG